MKQRYVMSRKNAFKFAWAIFKMATGTKRVGFIFDPEEDSVTLVGNDYIEEMKA